MKAIQKKLQRIFVPKEQLPKMRNANLALVLFFLDDELLFYKDGTFYYTLDENYTISGSEAYHKSDGCTYNTLDFIVSILFKNEKNAFYKATLYLSDFLRYVDTDSYALMQKFKLHYEVDFDSSHSTVAEPVTNLYYNLVKEHNSQDNKYLFAYFCKTCHYNKDFIKDLIFRNLLVVDRDKNACFITYTDIFNPNEILAAYRIATNPKLYFMSHQGVSDWLPILYTPFRRFEQIYLYYNIHDLMCFCSQEYSKGLSGTSFACAFLPSASQQGIDWLKKKYPTIEIVEQHKVTPA